ncbi:hypothetical protein [Aquabacterium sp. J223]|uniref:hypothetical protein n=1 Tax=Aquabacterium sp. J223 TaxID=2898431 RepID=UPI0021AD963E|nr:hypothetical protein [Aquabacterium sp. J223]UUX95738.1 hypothetical protein LRS07_21530 [Aquabacterium sp. J223]
MRPPLLLHVAVLAALMSIGLPVRAQESDAGDEPAEPEPASSRRGEVKLTLGHYAARHRAAPDGTDLNLRWRRHDTTLWAGAYHDADVGRTARAGIEDRRAPWREAPVKVLSSFQVASGGFRGGQLGLETGERWYAQVSLARTNGRPYVNLNFDPNDAVIVAGGWRDEATGAFAVTAVRDDRFGTGQQHVHLNGQWVLPDHQRLTVDLLRKQGRGDDQVFIRRTGLTVTWDLPHWFARLAWDPRQNFGPADVLRLSVGARF